jgi:hypothetical protein
MSHGFITNAVSCISDDAVHHLASGKLNEFRINAKQGTCGLPFLLMPTKSKIGMTLPTRIRLGWMLRVVKNENVGRRSLCSNHAGILRHVPSSIHFTCEQSDE